MQNIFNLLKNLKLTFRYFSNQSLFISQDKAELRISWTPPCILKNICILGQDSFFFFNVLLFKR